jgi:hypothetical protein
MPIIQNRRRFLAGLTATGATGISARPPTCSRSGLEFDAKSGEI